MGNCVNAAASKKMSECSGLRNKAFFSEILLIIIKNIIIYLFSKINNIL